MYVLWRVIVKEFLQLLRDRRMIPILFLSPIIQLTALGYAADLDVTNVPLVVVDQDHTPASRRLIADFAGSRYFRWVGSEASVDAVEPWLVDGEASLALVIGSGYGDAVAAGHAPSVQLLADGSDATSGGIALDYAAGLLRERSGRLVRDRARQLLRDRRDTSAALGGVRLEPRVWYNPDLRSRWFYVPAVLAMILVIITMVVASMGVVREKEIGTMEQLIVTPIRSWQLIVGKLAPFAVIGLVDMLLVSAVAVFWFQVPLRGSMLLLLGLTLLLLLNTLGLGLLVSTLVRNQQQAMMTSAFMITLPMIYLSGLIFPISNMPPAIQVATYAIPLRYYAEIVRGIFLKGSGIDALWPQAVILAGTGVLILTLAALRFRKRLD